MTREEFELWLDDHKDEAVDRIEENRMALPTWIRFFSKSLKALQEEFNSQQEDDGDVELGFE